MPKKKSRSISSLRGMHDIVPEEAPYWNKVRGAVFDIAKFYNFGYLSTPIIEDTALFERTVGISSDIVTKEMYTFRTKGGDSVSLRPEGTAPTVRAYIEHGWASLPQPVKLFYWAPMFRHEKPQAGRYRQHHEFGFEIIGLEEALADAEIVQMTFAVLRDVGLKNIICEVNTIGDKECRKKYRQELKDYFRSRVKKQCSDCRERYKTNPLRMLDCKQETCQEFIKNAPQIIDYISEGGKENFKRFLEFLDESELPYLLNPHLVRGLDYYNDTVFEIFPEEKDSRQSALAAGGRYDELVSILGGKPTPAVGVAGGIERIIAEMKKNNVRVSAGVQPKIFLVQLGELAKKKGLTLMESLRKAGVSISESLGRHSIRSQMKIADKLGVKLVLILGQKEALAEEIIIRDMKSGVQETVSLAKLMSEIKRRLKAD